MSEQGDPVLKVTDKGDSVPDQLERFPEFETNHQVALPATSTSTTPTQPPAAIRRGRARSNTLVDAQNPIECPVNAAEQQLANLAHSINRSRRLTGGPPPPARPPSLHTLREASPNLCRVEGSSPDGSSTGSVTPTNSPAGSVTPTQGTTSVLPSSHTPATRVQSSIEEAADTDPFRSHPHSTSGQSATEEATGPIPFPQHLTPGQFDTAEGVGSLRSCQRSTSDHFSIGEAVHPLRCHPPTTFGQPSTEEAADPLRLPQLSSSGPSSTEEAADTVRSPANALGISALILQSPYRSHQRTTSGQSSPEEAGDPIRSRQPTTSGQPSTEEATRPFDSPANALGISAPVLQSPSCSHQRTASGQSSAGEAGDSIRSPGSSPSKSPTRARSTSPSLPSPFRSPRRVDYRLTTRFGPLGQTPPRSSSAPPHHVAPPIWPTYHNLVHNIPTRRSPPPNDATDPQIRRVVVPLPSPQIFASLQSRRMQNYPSYLDSAQSSPGPNPRQAPSPSQGMHQNGVNGGMAAAGGMVGFPTPAGHQSDLNYIMQMVEELAGQLAHNQGLTAGIVDKMGKVRAKAKNLDLSNDELLAIAASELNESSENLEKENSELRKALEEALYEKKENWKLAVHGANIMSDILDKMHKFKAQHEEDTLAWHRNYRKQLSDEREESMALRNQINDMKAAACRANEHLRQMRHYLTDHDELNELRIQNIALRQDRRIWKRMALPLIPDDDSEWSDDDDIIDPEEKKRLADEKENKERKDKEGGEEGGDAQGPTA